MAEAFDISGGAVVAATAARMAESEAMGEVIVAGVADIAAAMAVWLGRLAVFDREERWRDLGCGSCAQWLSWKCGLASSTARQHVQVARALEDLPAVTGAFRRGDLSYCKVRALIRIATPDTEAELVDLAKVATGAQMAAIARGYRQTQSDPATSKPQAIDVSWDDDGDMVIQAKVPADVGHTFLRAMSAAAKCLNGDDNDDDDSEGAGDAAGPGDAEGDAVAASAVEPGHEATKRQAGLVATFEAVAELALIGASDAAASPPPPDLVVMVTPEQLRASGPDCPAAGIGGSAAGFAGTFGLSPAMLGRLACDATTATLLHGEAGSPLDLGRRRRTISPAQRTALHVRAGGQCEAPGCGHRWFLQGHHIHHWTDGGPTDMANLALLCSHHHRLLHDECYSITVENGATVFRAPDHTVMAPRTGVADTALREELPQAEGTPTATWAGERLDLGLTIDAILGLEMLARQRHEQSDAAASLPGSMAA